LFRLGPSVRRKSASGRVSDSSPNGFRTVTLALVVGIGIAAVTGIVSWTFATVYVDSKTIERILTRQDDVLLHDTLQDRQINELDDRLRNLEMAGTRGHTP
jgi:hypothetical protein